MTEFLDLLERYNCRGIVLDVTEEAGLGRLVDQDGKAAETLLARVKEQDWRVALYFLRLAAKDEDPIAALGDRVRRYIAVRETHPVLAVKPNSDEYRIPSDFRRDHPRIT